MLSRRNGTSIMPVNYDIGVVGFVDGFREFFRIRSSLMMRVFLSLSSPTIRLLGFSVVGKVDVDSVEFGG